MGIVKYTRRWLSCGIVCLFVLFVFSNGAWGLITGSKHDFSSSGTASWQTVEDEICIPCHTPHNANTIAPLWNHEMSVMVYTLYTSPTGTMDSVVGQPGPASKVCLACHDGTVAEDAYGAHLGSVFMSGDAAVGAGGNLNDDHPIGMEWGHETVGAGTCTICHTPPGFGTPSNVPMFDGKVECSTCHDPHNTYPYRAMVRINTVDSEICKTCHTDK